jgi:hypothetical protein
LAALSFRRRTVFGDSFRYGGMLGAGITDHVWTLAELLF